MPQETKRQEIIRQIQQLAAETSDGAPGQRKFASITGIKEHLWRGKYWRNWGEALIEAGFSANEWNSACDDRDLIKKISNLAIRLGYFPKSADISIEAHNHPGFPHPNAIRRRWSMAELASEVIDYAENIDNENLVRLAQDYLENQKPKSENDDTAKDDSEPQGYVYMYRYGADYKIGRTNSLNKRSRQVQIELPKETVLIHSILTDDPVGIEAYWHKRFADKRGRGNGLS